MTHTLILLTAAIILSTLTQVNSQSSTSPTFTKDSPRTWKSNRHADRIAKLSKLYPNTTFSADKFMNWSDIELGRLRTRKMFAPTVTQNGANGSRRFQIQRFSAQNNITIPKSFDWRTEGHVTPVKDQGSCGSCYAFSSLASVESMYSILGYGKHSFSEQQIVDCNENTSGCEGGNSPDTFSYIAQNGIEFEDDYGYKAKSGVCEYDQTLAKVKISGYYSLKSESEIEQYVAFHGPVSIGIKAPNSLVFYRMGIWNPSVQECSDTEYYHALTIIGYGSESGVDYWIVKNSWGTNWGEGGFLRMTRNRDVCGLTTIGGIQNSAPYVETRDLPRSLMQTDSSNETKVKFVYLKFLLWVLIAKYGL